MTAMVVFLTFSASFACSFSSGHPRNQAYWSAQEGYYRYAQVCFVCIPDSCKFILGKGFNFSQFFRVNFGPIKRNNLRWSSLKPCSPKVSVHKVGVSRLVPWRLACRRSAWVRFGTLQGGFQRDWLVNVGTVKPGSPKIGFLKCRSLRGWLHEDRLPQGCSREIGVIKFAPRRSCCQGRLLADSASWRLAPCKVGFRKVSILKLGLPWYFPLLHYSSFQHQILVFFLLAFPCVWLHRTKWPGIAYTYSCRHIFLSSFHIYI